MQTDTTKNSNPENQKTFEGRRYRVVEENEDFKVLFLPGRTVYIDSLEGSQYQPAEYVVLGKTLTDEDVLIRFSPRG